MSGARKFDNRAPWAAYRQAESEYFAEMRRRADELRREAEARKAKEADAPAAPTRLDERD